MAIELMKFSVLMSVYGKEKADNLRESLESILVRQTVKPNQIVLVKDGSLTSDLIQIIDRYRREFDDILDVIDLEENIGLGGALSIGLNSCKYEWIARMDSDDISVPDRFEKQLNFLKENPWVDVCGGNIEEFYDSPDDPVYVKTMPLHNNEIIRRMKIRNPVNHVTVMYKMHAVKNAGGYIPLAYLEDYFLWIRMAQKGCRFRNLDDILVKVRTGRGMYKRRGSREQIAGWLVLQNKMLEMRLIKKSEAVRNMICITLFVYCPVWIRKLIYRFICRKKWTDFNTNPSLLKKNQAKA